MHGTCNPESPRKRAGRGVSLLSLLLYFTSPAAAQVGLIDEIRTDGLMNSTVAFTDVSLAAECNKKPYTGCKSGATARYIPISATEKVADELEKAWKEFQDAAYFHMNAKLNPGLPMGLTGGWPNCLLGIGGGSFTPRETPVITKVEEDDLIKDTLNLFSPKLKQMLPIKPNDGVRWDFVGQYRESKLFPSVSTGAFCNEAPVSPKFFPPDNTYPLFPSAAYQPSRLDNGFVFGPYPAPIQINWRELSDRLKDGCETVRTKLYPNYVKKALAATVPLALTGTTWRPANPLNGLIPGSRSEMLLQPVYESDPRRIPSNLQRIVEIATKTLDPRAPQYYAMTGAFGPNLTSPGRTGIKSLEDPKRFFPPMPLEAQQRAGVATLCQVWNSTDIVREQRPLTLFTFATTCAGIWPYRGCAPVGPLPIPAPETVMTLAGCVSAPAPGAGGLTMTLPRMHYQYVNVPEGYGVPDIEGDPFPLR